MKIPAIQNRVTMDEPSMEASSVEAAVSELNIMVQSDWIPGAPATRTVVTAEGEAPVIVSLLPLRPLDHIRTSGPPAPNFNAVQCHYIDELNQTFSVLKSLAAGTVTKQEVAPDKKRSPEDVYRTRDHPTEYAEFMRYVYLGVRTTNETLGR